MIASAWYHDSYFGDCKTPQPGEDLKKYKLLILWGGEDINPCIYGQKNVLSDSCGDTPSVRDSYEMELIKEATRIGIPILGVCRGAQLLCCVDGGSLWQHVDNHAGYGHELVYKNQVGITNSAHHQMMRISKEAIVLASAPNLSEKKFSDSKTPVKDLNPEPEIVFFPKLRAVGVQGHPEWLGKPHFLNRVLSQVVKEKLNFDLR